MFRCSRFCFGTTCGISTILVYQTHYQTTKHATPPCTTCKSKSGLGIMPHPVTCNIQNITQYDIRVCLVSRDILIPRQSPFFPKSPGGGEKRLSCQQQPRRLRRRPRLLRWWSFHSWSRSLSLQREGARAQSAEREGESGRGRFILERAPASY